MQLALKHGVDHQKFLIELSENYSYRVRLQTRSNVLEFSHFLRQISNVLHRLKFITGIVIDNLNKIKPCLVDIRAGQGSHSEHGLIFSQSEQDTHLQHVEQENNLPRILKYSPTSQQQQKFKQTELAVQD